MSDIICPVCGKTNAETAETCYFCGTELKQDAAHADKPAAEEHQAPPGTGKTSSAPGQDLLAGLSQLGGEDEEETPDWLKNLQGSLPAAQPEPEPDPQEETGKFPGSGEPSDQPESSEDQGTGFTDVPAAFQFDETSEAGSPHAESAPDWLNELIAHDEATSSAAKFDAPASEAGADPSIYTDLPDWLSALTGSPSAPALEQPAPEPAPQQPVPTDDTSGWLAGLGGDFINPDAPDSTLEPAAPAEAETPDWLARMGTDTPAESTPAESTPAENAPVSNLPDWLASLQASDEAAEALKAPGETPSGDQPDWMSGLQASDQAPFINTPETPEAINETHPGEQKDWMSGLQAQQTPFTTNDTPETPAETPSGDLPDWMASLQADQPATTPSNLPEIPEAPGEIASSDVPDWMSSLQAPEQAADEPKTPDATTSGELPDWMSALQASDQASDAPKNLPETPGEQSLPEPRPFDTAALGEITGLSAGSDLPDWITSLGQTPKSTPGPAQDESVSSGAPETPAALTEAAGDSKVTEPQIEAVGEPVVSQPVEVQPAPAEVPQSEVESLIPDSAGEQNIDSILSMDTPDWLSGFEPSGSEPATSPTVEASSDENLPSGELPSWVQAMRPMESVLAEADDSGEEQVFEKQGPLAGLHSVLPTQPGLVGVRTPQAFSTGLLTNETQQAQAALLKNLLNSENTPQEFSKRSDTAPDRPLRWLIAAVLLLSITVIAAFGSRIFPAPAQPAETSPVGLFIKTVKSLPDGAPLLVVMDYQPGFAGELEAAAGPAMEQLMSKQTRLAFVSTTPLGGLMAERLMQKYASLYPYQAGVQYVNLGYLPGGAGGIRAFADQPRSTLGRDIITGNMWDSPVLEGVTVNSETSLSNFSAVIVATDNADTARLWIEQAQPLLKSKPMLMVVSAQAEPMVRPYLHSNQLNGLVAGLEGGMLYETALDKPGQARAEWDAFGVGILVSVLLILIGGVWNLISGLRARRTTMEQDEA